MSMVADSHLNELLPRATLPKRLVASSLLGGTELERSLKWRDAQPSDVDRTFAVSSLVKHGSLTPFQATA